MSDASALPDDPSSRPSRQQLVVPPRSSPWPLAVGAIASAAAGFGLVLFLGIGRGRPQPDATPLPPAAMAETAADSHPPATLAHDAAPAPPGLLPPADDLVPPASDRWSPRGESKPAPVEPASGDRYADRYPARPVSHDESPAADPVPVSRFSSPDLPPPPAADEPADLTPADLEPAAITDEPAEQFLALPPADADPPSVSEPPAADTDAQPPAAAAAEPPAAETAAAPPAAADESNPVTPASDEPAAVAVTDPELSGPTGVEPEPTAVETAVPEPARPVELDPPVAGRQFAADLSPAPPAELPAIDPPAATPVAGRQFATDRSHAPPAEPPAIAPPAATPAGGFATPVGLPSPPVPPFAAAPPLAPEAAAPPAPDSGFAAAGGPVEPAAPSDPVALSAPAGIEGQGLPGPVQLEGVQAPQLAVEKRGPREIQVGKPARYEILVRNVGAAVAHEVTLRDAVPQGTSLIATTPPASPAEDDAGPTGELVWLLGDLQPGGEVRVLVELMPETEGEVGSVASVSFRADATLRSRATKPELALDCPPAEPVRIGGDLEIAVTVSNPGSGTATGVVVETFLPETVSHRAGSELEFDVGQLRPGESKTIDLVLGTRSPGSQPARFVARADGGIEVDRLLPIPVTAPTLELAIDMPARRFLQRPATCSISMTNTGTASARSVELAAQLPPGMKFVRANNAGWHDERSHRVLWNLEELPAGETGTVAVVVMPVQAGEQRITAAARSVDGPSDQALHACQVEGLAAVAFQVADSEDPIEVDGVTEYVVRVTNEGTKAASGVRLAANLLGDLEPVEAEGPGRHRVENLAIEFEPLAKLGPGEEVVYRIRARGRRAGHQRVQVQLTTDDHPTPITKEEVTSVYDDR
jgi:uncharacterized repeat protein (TIGR01451 family)